MDLQKIIYLLLLENQGGLCPKCNRDLTTDGPCRFRYIVSLKEGGLERIENVKMIHAHCVTQERRELRKEATLRLRKEGKRAIEIAEKLQISLRSVYLYLESERGNGET